MTAIFEAIRAALASLLAHRMRSFLTTLGILIGTASVIAVVSLIQGFSAFVTAQFAGIGGSTLTLQAYTPFDEAVLGRENFLTFDDVDVLRHRVAGVDKVVPTTAVPVPGISVRGRTALAQVLATSSEFTDVQALYPNIGRFLVASDDQSRRRVVVIGPEVQDKLELPPNPVGQFIRIGNDWFKVVGVMERRGQIFGLSQDNYVVIPFDVGRTMTGAGNKTRMEISFTASNLSEVDGLRERVKRAIRQSHKLKPGQEDDFKIQTAESALKSFEEFASMTTAVLAGVVGISLLVGGIGIMNIMLVSVTERTREIGILKALGATRRDILVQFLAEAGLLALLGGLIGIVLGWLAGMGISALIPNFPPASVPAWVVLAAAGFSALVGIVFGIMPASKAAGLDPIEALRYE
jgi:putative ABC transport system permease protein